MDKELYICIKCQNWLTGQITRATNGEFFCQSCSSHMDGERDNALETYLRILLYPCLYGDCNFIGKNNHILEHTQQCEHALNDCYLCKESKMNFNTYTEHIKIQHIDSVQDVPAVTLSIKQLVQTEKFIVLFKKHIFHLYIKFIDGKIVVNVTKLFHNTNEDFSKLFTVSFKCEGNYQELTKSMILCPPFKRNGNDSTEVKVINPTEIKIFFCNFNKTIPLGECPICEHDLDVLLYQCSNGYNVCHTCGIMLTSCAICRENTLKSVNLQYLFPEFLRRCENAERGCLFIGEKYEQNQHLTKCLYKTIVCKFCDANICKPDILTHMQYNHDDYEILQNAAAHSTEIIDDDVSVLFYILYNNELFCVQGETVGELNEQERKCGFSVRMIYNRDISEARKYSFEIQILEKDNNEKAVHSLRGICQTADDKAFVVFINFAMWKNYYMVERCYTNDVFYRCVITKTDIN